MAEVQTTTTEVSEAKPERIRVVTSENFHAYVNEKLGIDPEAQAKEELAEIEEKKAADKATKDDPTPELDETVQKEKKGKINERFKELTDKRKAAEELATKRAEEARAAREERDRLAEERDALKAKYEPPKSTEEVPEPQPSQFSDVSEYGKALKDWTAENTRREDTAIRQAAQQAEEAKVIAKAWGERLTATKTELADYEEVLNASEVKVSDQVRDAIIKSEVGPKILYHLAQHPEVAEKIGEMTVGKALVYLGKLEAELGSAEKPQTKSAAVAEISKAPTPITPLKGGTAAVGILRGTDDVPKGMTYDQWAKLYRVGKIH